MFKDDLAAARQAWLEDAVAQDDADFIEANLPALERAIEQLQNKIHGLAELQYRARRIRDQHGPAS